MPSPFFALPASRVGRWSLGLALMRSWFWVPRRRRSRATAPGSSPWRRDASGPCWWWWAWSWAGSCRGGRSPRSPDT